MAEDHPPVSKATDRESYYSEHGWDGADLFGNLFQGDKWHLLSADVTQKLRVSRMIDQIAWLVEVPKESRATVLSAADTHSPEGAHELQIQQLNLLENRLMTLKMQVHRQATQAGVMLKQVDQKASPEGDGCNLQ
jgi:hypothetical protein